MISKSLQHTKWKVGGKVSLEKWDDTEPPWNKLGPCTIMLIKTKQRCESGIMITVRNSKGSEQRLDSSWLTKMS